MSDITAAVVRGWLSRLSPGPWATNRTETGEGQPIVEVNEAGGDDRTVCWFSDQSGETLDSDLEAVARLPELLQQFVTVAGEMVAVNAALRAAGVTSEGAAGVRVLDAERQVRLETLAAAERNFAAQGAAWDETLRELKTANARLTAVREYVGELSGRQLGDEATGLYLELTARLMTTAPTEPTERATDEHDNDQLGE